MSELTGQLTTLLFVLTEGCEKHPSLEEPCYNSCALWVAMNMVYSDDIRTIADLMGKAVDDMSAEEMVRATHAFAVNKLKDADGVFNIRKYFGLQ